MTIASAKHPPALALPETVAAEIVALAIAEKPSEACGLLIGAEAKRRIRVVRQVAGRNVHPRSSERFTLAPEDFLAAEMSARADGLAVIGFWHSHPASSPRPSATDRAAAWAGYSYVIVSLATAAAAREHDGAEVRSWRLVANRLVEQEIVAPAAADAGEAPA